MVSYLSSEYLGEASTSFMTNQLKDTMGLPSTLFPAYFLSNQ